MRLMIRQKLIMRRTIALASIVISLSGILFFIFNITGKKNAFAATTNETLTSGAFIVNMGVTPQTYANGLKPYGLIYDLMINYKVPIKWVIEPTKSRDGTDFTYGATSYKGGTFIVPSEYINSTVTSRITYWKTLGVQGVYTTSGITVPVYATLTNFPSIIIDAVSGKQSIIIKYFTNAGIPSGAYETGSPSLLTYCHDMWVNPHGDPVWSTHGYLYELVTVAKSYVWSQCHAVSAMEGVKNSASPFQQLSFLTTNGLKCYGSNNCGTAITQSHAGNPISPFTHHYATDPIMQFMGTMDGATDGGSEKWYIPQSTGAWRSTTKRLVTTSDGASPNEGVLMAYGPAYGDTLNGYVMYEGGHDLDGNGSTAEKVAGQRAFFNFVLLSGLSKQLVFNSATMPAAINAGSSTAVSVAVSAGSPGYAYDWSSTIGGAFANKNAASTTFTAPPVVADVQGFLSCQVVDACGRTNFVSRPLAITGTNLPITLKDFTAKKKNNTVELAWSTSSEINNEYFVLERSANGNVYVLLGKVNGAGNSTRDLDYSFIDASPLNGNNYYKLTQYDFDGKSESFPPVAVKFQNQNETENRLVRASPVPFEDHLRIEFFVREAGDVEFSLVNRLGQTLKLYKTTAREGTNFFEMAELFALENGIYILSMNCRDGTLHSLSVMKK